MRLIFAISMSWLTSSKNAILDKAGKNQKEIAVLVNVPPSIISRELQRNKGKKDYRPKQAQLNADNRRKFTARPLKMEAMLRSSLTGC